MNIQTLLYFDAISRLGSLRKASEECHVAEPALSRHLRSLEEELGCRLFERTTKGMVLTKLGRDFLDEALPVVNQYRGLTEFAAGLGRGHQRQLAVGTIPAYSMIVAKAAAAFVERHPSAVVSIVESSTADLTASMAKNELDLAIMRTPVLLDGVGIHRLADDPMVVFMRKDDPMKGQSVIFPSDFVTRNLVTLRPILQFSGVAEVLESLQESGVPIRPRFFVDNFSVLLHIVVAARAVGIAPISSWAVNREDVTVRPYFDNINLPIVLVVRHASSRGFVSEFRILLEDIGRQFSSDFALPKHHGVAQ